MSAFLDGDEDAVLAKLRGLSDPRRQAEEAQALIVQVRAAIADARVIRADAVEALYAAGWTQQEIGKHMGLSQVAVSRIINPPEPKPKPPKQPRVSRARPRKPKDLS